MEHDQRHYQVSACTVAVPPHFGGTGFGVWHLLLSRFAARVFPSTVNNFQPSPPRYHNILWKLRMLLTRISLETSSEINDKVFGML